MERIAVGTGQRGASERQFSAELSYVAQLLERQRELQVLSEALTHAKERRGSLALISGEAGVGKSSLIRAFAESNTSATVLTGNCDPLPTPPALGPLLESAPRLGVEFVQLLDGSRPGPLLYPAMLAYLQARTTPTVLAFDDVHWADQATLELVGYLGRRIERQPLVLVCMYRSTDASGPLSVLLGDLAGAAGVIRLELQPLSPAATAELVGTEVGAGVHVVHRMTGGNPFFITEILRGGTGAIPRTVRDAVLARLVRLSSEARDAVYAGAAIGVSMETGLLITVLEQTGTPPLGNPGGHQRWRAGTRSRIGPVSSRAGPGGHR